VVLVVLQLSSVQADVGVCAQAVVSVTRAPANILTIRQALRTMVLSLGKVTRRFPLSHDFIYQPSFLRAFQHYLNSAERTGDRALSQGVGVGVAVRMGVANELEPTLAP